MQLWTEALTDYRRALGADPDDQDAKFNHELVERRLAALKKKLEEQQKQQQNQQQQDKKQQDQQQDKQKQDQQQQDQQQGQQQDQQKDQQQQGGQQQDQDQKQQQQQAGQDQNDQQQKDQQQAEQQQEKQGDQQNAQARQQQAEEAQQQQARQGEQEGAAHRPRRDDAAGGCGAARCAAGPGDPAWRPREADEERAGRRAPGGLVIRALPLVALLLALAPVAEAAVTVRATLDPPRVAVGESSDLAVEVRGTQSSAGAQDRRRRRPHHQLCRSGDTALHRERSDERLGHASLRGDSTT